MMCEIFQRVLCAMYVSEEWYASYERHYYSKWNKRKRLGLYSKVRSIVVHDRILNGRTADGTGKFPGRW